MSTEQNKTQNANNNDNNANNAGQTAAPTQVAPEAIVVAAPKYPRSRWFAAGTLIGAAVGAVGVLAYQRYAVGE